MMTEQDVFMFYTVINIIFLAIAIALIVSQRANYRQSETNVNTEHSFADDGTDILEEKSLSLYIEKHFYKFVAFLFFVTVLTSTFKLGDVPYGLNVDEAGMAYDAISLVNYGVDRYLKPYPVYFINFGGGQNAMYTYLAALFIKVFDYSTVIIRLPAVLLRFLTFIAIYFIMKSEYGKPNNKEKSLLLLFLFSVCPYFIMQSRWGLESNLLVGFLTISICLLIYSIRNNSTKLFFASGISFGLTLYTYALSYIIIPVFLCFIGLYLYFSKKVKICQIVLFLLPLSILSLPLILMILVNNGFIPEINGVFTIPLLDYYRGGEVSFRNIFSNYYIIISMLSFDNPRIYGRELFFNAIPYFGTVYYFSIPFFLVGVLSTYRKALSDLKAGIFNVDLIFATWFFSVLACQFVILAPNINKVNAVFVPVFYFVTIGIIETVGKWNGKKSIFLVVLICYLLNFSLFCNYYFNQYNQDSKGLLCFATDYLDVVKFSSHLNKKEINILDNIIIEPYIYVLLENQVPSCNFSKNNIKTFNEGLERTYTFKSPDILKADVLEGEQRKNDKAYVVFNNDYWYNIFNGHGLKRQVFGNICVYY